MRTTTLMHVALLRYPLNPPICNSHNNCNKQYVTDSLSHRLVYAHVLDEACQYLLHIS